MNGHQYGKVDFYLVPFQFKRKKKITLVIFLKIVLHFKQKQPYTHRKLPISSKGCHVPPPVPRGSDPGRGSPGWSQAVGHCPQIAGFLRLHLSLACVCLFSLWFLQLHPTPQLPHVAQGPHPSPSPPQAPQCLSSSAFCDAQSHAGRGIWRWLLRGAHWPQRPGFPCDPLSRTQRHPGHRLGLSVLGSPSLHLSLDAAVWLLWGPPALAPRACRHGFAVFGFSGSLQLILAEPNPWGAGSRVPSSSTVLPNSYLCPSVPCPERGLQKTLFSSFTHILAVPLSSLV